MALIKCPECGKEQSSYAKKCSQCSFPLEDYALNSENFVFEKEDLTEEIDEVLKFEESEIINEDSIDVESEEAELIEANESEEIINEPESKSLFINMGIFHRIMDWIFSITILIISLVPLISGDLICGLMWLGAGILLMPVNAILNLWDLALKGNNKWIRPVFVILAVFVGLIIAAVVKA